MAQPSLDLRHHHIGISVPDLEESIAWYCRVLDFEVESRSVLPPVPADVAFLRHGPVRIELFCPRNGNPLPAERRVPDQDLRTHGTKHGSFAVADVEETAALLRARGADIVFVKHMADASVMFVRDNSGNLIEFFQSPAA